LFNYGTFFDLLREKISTKYYYPRKGWEDVNTTEDRKY
jgi:hypothetical protein